MDCALICYARLYGDVSGALRQLCAFGHLYSRRGLGVRLLERCLGEPCNPPECACRCGKIGDEVYDALAEVGAATAKYIARMLRRGYASVVRRLDELVASGIVRVVECSGVSIYTCL